MTETNLQVLFLTGEYPPMQGGIADYTAHLARHLRPLGVEAAVLTSRKYPPGDRRLARVDGVPVYPLLSGWGWRCWPEIARFLDAHAPHVLHIQYQAAAFDLKGWVNLLPWVLRRRRRRPALVVTFHDLRIPYLFPKAGRLRWRAMLTLARHSDAVICTNAEDAATLRRFPWGTHVAEIPLGNNIPVAPPDGYDRRAWRARLGLTADSLLLAYFGFLNESKGGEDLIAVLDALVRRGVDAHLLMIGGDVGDSDPTNADYAARVRRQIADRNLSPRIHFTGYVPLPDVSAYMLAADAAVMPYRDGVSFRRTTLIAILRHGLPVISTTPAVPLPQIVAGETMLLAPPGDVESLTRAVLRVASDPALRQTLSAGARRLGMRFDWSTIAAQTAQLYRTNVAEICGGALLARN